MKITPHVIGGVTDPYEDTETTELYDIIGNQLLNGNQLRYCICRVTSIIDVEETVAGV